MFDERKHRTFYFAVQKVSWSDKMNKREGMKEVIQMQSIHFCAIQTML